MPKQISEIDEAKVYAQVEEEQSATALKKGVFAFKPFLAFSLRSSRFFYSLFYGIPSTRLYLRRNSIQVWRFPIVLLGDDNISCMNKSSNSQYKILGSPYVNRVVHKNWLANNSAIHLVLEIDYEESSQPVSTTAQIIYDFRRAELFTLCDLPLWRSYNVDGGAIDKGWMTANEFETVRSRLQKS